MKPYSSNGAVPFGQFTEVGKLPQKEGSLPQAGSMIGVQVFTRGYSKKDPPLMGICRNDFLGTLSTNIEPNVGCS